MSQIQPTNQNTDDELGPCGPDCTCYPQDGEGGFSDDHDGIGINFIDIAAAAAIAMQQAQLQQEQMRRGILIGSLARSLENFSRSLESLADTAARLTDVIDGGSAPTALEG